MSWKNYTEEQLAGYAQAAEAKLPPLLDDAKIAAMADKLFRKGIAAKKVGNYVAAVQNTTGKTLKYHVKVGDQRVAREIPAGHWAKVSPAGEFNVQIASSGESTIDALNDKDSGVATFEAAEPPAGPVWAVHEPHRVVDAVSGAAVGAQLEVDEVETDLVE